MDLSILKKTLFEILVAHPAGVREYDLIQLLKKRGMTPFRDLSFQHALSMYRCHFLLFHILYLLRDELLNQQRADLVIGPLQIQLKPYSESGLQGLTAPDPLREYYLDFHHYQSTTEEEVHGLLDNFWQKHVKSAHRDQALAVLGLHEPVDLRTIKKRYRELAMAHHPDRGGSAQKQQQLNHAMAVLRRYYQIDGT